MPTSSSTSPDPTDFVCGCLSFMQMACHPKGFYKTYQDKPFCLVHYPGPEKSEDFLALLREKLKKHDYNFYSFWFSTDVSFAKVTFDKEAHFGEARFIGRADFRESTFKADASFNFTQFRSTTDFAQAEFQADANFTLAWFSSTVAFHDVRFERNAIFDIANFGAKDSTVAHQYFGGNKEILGDTPVKDEKTVQVDLRGAVFKGFLTFVGTQFAERVFFNFDSASFEKPELVTFDNTSLRPHWFLKADSRKFTFRTVKWKALDERNATRREIDALLKSMGYGLSERNATREEIEVRQRIAWRNLPLLEIAVRQLAVNAEDNNRYEEASKFRYMAMEASRLKSWGGFAPWRLSWWYWLLSGYGERAARAFVALLMIWLLFAVLYWTGNGRWWQTKQASRPAIESSGSEKQSALSGLSFPEALVYSVGVLTLQKPEPLPASKVAKMFVLLETGLGPLQAALLALAIRRKFMR